jgi:hypothetical protein
MNCLLLLSALLQYIYVTNACFSVPFYTKTKTPLHNIKKALGFLFCIGGIVSIVLICYSPLTNQMMREKINKD